MKRLGKLVTPLLVVVSFALHRGDFIDGRQALIAIVLVEMLLAARMLFRSRRLASAYRVSRAAGLNRGDAARAALTALGNGPAARIFAAELMTWISLWRFARGGWKRTAGEFSYHQRSPLVGLVFVTVITAPAEILLFELIVPWPSVRLLLLVVALYSVLWILGYGAAQIGSPHRLGATDLVINKGYLASATIPFDAIESVELVAGATPKAADRWGAAALDGVAFFAVAGQADVRVRLRRPLIVRNLLDDTEPCGEFRIAADQPVQFINAIAARIAPPPELALAS